MEHPSGHPALPAAYYRRHAARVRALADDAATSAVKQHLNQIALEYEQLAERVEEASPIAEQAVSD
jgi:hypothetical protein